MKKIIQLHRFFVKHSPAFYKIVSEEDGFYPDKLFYYMHYPIAYIKFMYKGLVGK